MKPHRLLSLSLSLSLSLLLSLLCVLPANAQSDPPGRVGRVSLTSGQVDFREYANDWSRPALVNWPIVSGNVISTLRFGRAEVQIGSTALRLESETELEFKLLDDFHLVLRLNSGAVHIRVANPEIAPQFELLTAQGRLLLQSPSQVRVDFSLRPDATSVRLFSGNIRFENNGAGLLVQPGQQLALRQNEISTTPFTRDDFDEWSLSLDQPVVQTVQYVSNETTGYQELDRYGQWQVSDEHGPLWTPNEVQDDWAPYRYGSWTWIAPWGWTWVDHAAWGYAPFHYGRWVWWHHRWAWTPGPRVERPVWSPAMVGWVHHRRTGTTVLGQGGNIGWYPLQPGEIYQPGYTTSIVYYRHVNGNLLPPGVTRRGSDDFGRHDRNGALTSLPQAQFTANTVVPVQAPKTLPPRNTVTEPPRPHAPLNIGPIQPGQAVAGMPPAPPATRHTPPSVRNSGNNQGNSAGNNQGNNTVSPVPQGQTGVPINIGPAIAPANGANTRNNPGIPANSGQAGASNNGSALPPGRNSAGEPPRPHQPVVTGTPPAPGATPPTPQPGRNTAGDGQNPHRPGASPGANPVTAPPANTGQPSSAINTGPAQPPVVRGEQPRQPANTGFVNPRNTVNEGPNPHRPAPAPASAAPNTPVPQQQTTVVTPPPPRQQPVQATPPAAPVRTQPAAVEPPRQQPSAPVVVQPPAPRPQAAPVVVQPPAAAPAPARPQPAAPAPAPAAPAHEAKPATDAAARAAAEASARARKDEPDRR